ncbi:MAG: Gfo/Idh/MocA family oxidoreductase [Cyclobacteriaceae bacterium]
MKRRNFVKSSTLAASAVSIASAPASHLFRYRSPNAKLNVGVIGCNGMGWSNTNSILKMDDVDLVAICDVDKGVIDQRLVDYKKLRKNKPKVYGDYRELLQQKDLDAVIIGTPDHWHCKQMVDAVRAGLHVYVEKPVANSIAEAQIMVNAAKETGKVVQAGQWQRSGPHYRKALEIVQSGVLGNIRLVKVWAYQGWMKPVPVLPNASAPEGVDYKMWLGPAPDRPFNPNRFHFNFRWFWDYAGGLMTDWGVHEIDIALWVMNAVTPKSVIASGGKFAYPDDASETPDTLQAIFQYENFNMQWEHATGIDLGNYKLPEGIAFIGNNGTLVVNRQKFEVFPERDFVGWGKEGPAKIDPIESMQRPADVNYLDLHTQNFVEAVKANNPTKLNTPIDSGSLAAINAQMGNIAYKTGKKVYWQDDKQQFTDADANNLLMAQYNNGWTVSK